jgi:hypothetical protein
MSSPHPVKALPDESGYTAATPRIATVTVYVTITITTTVTVTTTVVTAMTTTTVTKYSR